MIVQRDIFAELTEGFDALKFGREGKRTLRTFKLAGKPAPSKTPIPAFPPRREGDNRGC